MAKKLLFCLLFASIQAFTFASSPWRIQFCDAPAPTNFEVTSMASDLVTLGWDPSVAGATHTLELMIEENGAWITLWINPEVPGESIVLDNLEPGSYLARLATNCESGEAGINVIDLNFDFKIIDLVVVGRLPKNPEIVQDCNQILYWKYEWVGFIILEKETNRYYIFEIDINTSDWSDHVFVRRLHNESIVAVNDFGIFPTMPNQLVNVYSPIKFHDLENPNIEVGHVILERVFPFPGPIVLKMCNLLSDPNKPWSNSYEFIPLVANDVIIDLPPDNASENNLVQEPISEISVRNPIINTVDIKISSEISEKQNTVFEIYDVNMKLREMYSSSVLGTEFQIPFDNHLPGVYFLVINSMHVFKLIKM